MPSYLNKHHGHDQECWTVAHCARRESLQHCLDIFPAVVYRSHSRAPEQRYCIQPVPVAHSSLPLIYATCMSSGGSASEWIPGPANAPLPGYQNHSKKNTASKCLANLDRWLSLETFCSGKLVISFTEHALIQCQVNIQNNLPSGLNPISFLCKEIIWYLWSYKDA